MEIFGIGPLELVLILLVALIVVGPKGMINLAKKTAELLHKLRKSEIWSTTREVMDMPNQIMKETGLDKELREIRTMATPPAANQIWQPSYTPIVEQDPPPVNANEQKVISPGEPENTPKQDDHPVSH